MTDFFAMGGYGGYVWSCVGLTLTVLVICTILAVRRQRSIINDIRARLSATESAE
jgi:heme exporter protein D